MTQIPLKYHTNKKFYTKYTHPTPICRGTDGQTDGRMENIYSIFRDKLLLLGEHVFPRDQSKFSLKCLHCGKNEVKLSIYLALAKLAFPGQFDLLVSSQSKENVLKYVCLFR